MIGNEHVSSEPITIAESKEILANRKKGSKVELGYEQKIAAELAENIVKISTEKAKKMKAELIDLGLPEKVAVSVVDVMPVNETQLKNTLVIGKKTFDDSEIKAIMDIVAKYSSK